MAKPLELVEVTPAMIKAGVEEAREKIWGCDLGEAVADIYMAMEYQRLAEVAKDG